MNEEKVKILAKNYIDKNIPGNFDFDKVFIRCCTLKDELKRKRSCGFDEDELKETESKFRKHWSIAVPKIFTGGDIVSPGEIILKVYEDNEEVTTFPTL